MSIQADREDNMEPVRDCPCPGPLKGTCPDCPYRAAPAVSVDTRLIEALEQIEALPKLRRHAMSSEWETTPLEAAKDIARDALAVVRGGRRHD